MPRFQNATAYPFLALIAALAASGVAGVAEPASAGPAKTPQTMVARFQDKDAVEFGNATARASRHGIKLTITVAGLAPGTYGLHLHEVGRCEGPEFKSAGGHWNPANKEHGHDNPKGAHLGDLRNLVVNTAGKGKMTVTLKNYKIGGSTGLRDADGTSIIIHAKPDDFRTDPSGNSGARVLCGVFEAPEM